LGGIRRNRVMHYLSLPKPLQRSAPAPAQPPAVPTQEPPTKKSSLPNGDRHAMLCVSLICCEAKCIVGIRERENTKCPEPLRQPEQKPNKTRSKNRKRVVAPESCPLLMHRKSQTKCLPNLKEKHKETLETHRLAPPTDSSPNSFRFARARFPV